MKLMRSAVMLSILAGVSPDVTTALEQETLPPEQQVFLVAPTAKEIMGWWTADGDATDSLALNQGRVYGDVTYAPGQVGQAFQLDGNKSYIKVPTSDLDPSKGAGFTLEMWIKPANVAEQMPIAGWSGTSTSGVSLWLEAAEDGRHAKLGADLRDTAGAAHRMLSDTPAIVADQWQHIALTYRKEGGIVSLFHNGRVVKERTLGPLTPQTSLDFSIGRHLYIGGGSVTFQGAIDEVSVYSRTLLPEEIQGIFNAQGAGKQLVSERDATLTKEKRWASINKRLANFAKKHDGNAMSFAAWIDGSDLVHVQGDRVWFVHQDWDLPGRNGGGNDPTWVNGEEWQPLWNENVSDKHPLATALPQTGEFKLAINALKIGGNLSPQGTDARIAVTQQPATANNFEAVLRLDDNNDPGAHWFIFSLSWRPSNRN